jgi:hypothetical protein
MEGSPAVQNTLGGYRMARPKISWQVGSQAHPTYRNAILID